MKPERYRQVDRVFQSALARDPSERAAFLDEVCAGDPGLRREVEALLASDEEAGGFIESPAVEIAPELVADDHVTTVTGRTVGHYRLEARLGSGGMGKVYLAHDLRLGRKVALKLLDPRLTGDSGLRSRFLREARLASSLDHQNVCAVHEVGEASGHLFIAMQYVEGETLKRVIDGRPLPLDSLLSVSLQVADALSSAHARGVIHRDIKAGNIIVTPRGQAKVLDFGLAKLIELEEEEADAELTLTGAVMGTPASMSPEQAEGQRADRRSDIFSLGVVMYEMATGRAPFKGKSRSEVIGALLREPHTPAAELNREIPARLSAVIDRALAKAPTDRYQSMPELIADLRQVVTEAGGLDHLFNSSESPVGALVPYVAPRRRAATRVFGRLTGRPFLTGSLAAGAALVVLGLTASSFWPKPPPPPAPGPAGPPAPSAQIKSIAVLPFKPLAAGGRDESLELGMADTLITRLSNLREVVVRPTSAVRRYTDPEQDAVAAGRELKVETVLDGNVQRVGDRVRVTARLVRVADGQALWAETFNEKLTHIFAVQDRLSEKVVTLLAVKLTGQEQMLLTKRHTENPEAYQLYLKGRHFWNQRTAEGLKKAVGHFERAIELDPQYALAYVGLAEAYDASLVWNSVSPDEEHAKAKAAALKALELDDTLAEAHGVLGTMKIYYEWDWPGAEKACRRALELNPNNAAAHQRYGEYLLATGRCDEALAEFRAALQLDPLSLMMHTQEGNTLAACARRYDEAIEKLRKTLEMDPNFMLAHVFLAETYAMKGMYEEAISEYQKAGVANGASVDEMAKVAAAMREAYATGGEQGYWRWWLNRFNERAKGQPTHNFNRARCYARLGENDQAFAWLEKAYQYKEAQMATLKITPALDNIRSDPRFQDLMRRVGFAP